MFARAHSAFIARGVAPTFANNIIVEAEMVAFSDILDRIDGALAPILLTSLLMYGVTEFWRIRSLIGSTAMGIRHKTTPRSSSDRGIEYVFPDHSISSVLNTDMTLSIGNLNSLLSPMPRTVEPGTSRWCFSTSFCSTVSRSSHSPIPKGAVFSSEQFT